MELSDLIRQVRGNRTQTEFAATCDATKQQVSDWERGCYKPSGEQLSMMGIRVVYEVEGVRLEKTSGSGTTFMAAQVPEPSSYFVDAPIERTYEMEAE